MGPNASVDFFDRQFRRQIEGRDYALNPFEQAALPWMRGAMLDLGCGLGNLAVAAARQGARVTALDASPAAVADLAQRARREGLAIEAQAADLERWRPARTWDAVACIGLLMFFPPAAARLGLAAVRDAVAERGVAAVNVLIEGTTYLDMFDGGRYCLFAEDELDAAFAGWQVLHRATQEFPAPGGAAKRFATLVARRPG